MMFSGICTVSNRKPCSRATSSMYKWMWGSLCPAKPIYRVDECTIGAFLVEDSMWIVIPQDLVVLHEIDAIGPQPLERLIELPRRFRVRLAVDLRHQKDLLPVAIPERISHAGLARAVVVVPAVVQKVDTTVDGRSNDPEAELLVDPFQSEMPASKADRGDSFSCPAQRAVRNYGLHNNLQS